MKSEKLVDKSWEKIDEVTCKQDGSCLFPGYITKYYDYIYKDKNDNYYLLRINSSSSSSSEKEMILYNAKLYKVNSITEHIPYIEDDNSYPPYIYLYSNEKVSTNNIYTDELSDEKIYTVKKETRKFWFITYHKWSVENNE